jgi:Uma2 family endonuclease
MTWQEIVNKPSLADLPYKIETNERGQVIMSPTVFLHGIYQSRVTKLLEQFLPDGITSNETAINTAKGTKVPDVTWFSYDFFEQHRDAADLPVAPPICIEVISKTNSVREINGKRKLYFEREAQEVWTCDLEGNLRFFDPKGELERSSLVPEFPRKIEFIRPSTANSKT